MDRILLVTLFVKIPNITAENTVNISTKLTKIFLIEPGCEDFACLFRKMEISDQVIQLELIKLQRSGNCAFRFSLSLLQVTAAST